MRKLTAFIMCLILALSFTSCGKSPLGSDNGEPTASANDEDTDETGAKKLSLYFCYSDNLSPYEAKSSGNKALSTLLFDPLIKLDKDINPQYVIANNVSVEGKKVTVSLNSYQFSDGSDISAEDVVYTIKTLKSAKSGLYVNQLSNVSSYSASGKYTLELNLKHYDRNVINTLDFPIIKSNSSDLVNNDGKKIPPIGSGRYVFVDNSGNYSLKPNDNYYGTKPKSSIKLQNTPDYKSLEYLIKAQEISIFYSGFATEEMPELKGTTKTVKLSNLVYIGLNSQNSFLKDKNIRNALSDSVDRTAISNKCYYSLGTSASSLFPDKFNIKEKTADFFENAENTKKAIEHLSLCGYNSINSDGYYTNSNGEYVKLNLLYNKENSMQSMTASNIVKQLKASGLCAVLNGVSASEYKTAVKNGNYDMYVAEIKLGKNFDYTALFDKTKNVLTKESETKKVASQYTEYMKGSLTTEDFLKIFADEMPFLPLVFRYSSISYSNNLKPQLISSASDPYYNIEQIKVK